MFIVMVRSSSSLQKHKLIAVQHRSAKGGKALFAEEFSGINELLGVWLATEAEPEGTHDLPGRIITTLAFQTFSKEFRLLQHERTVKQIQGLKRRR